MHKAFIYVHLISVTENIYNIQVINFFSSFFIIHSHWFWNIFMNYSTTGNNTEVISTLNLFPQKFKLSVQCNLSPLQSPSLIMAPVGWNTLCTRTHWGAISQIWRENLHVEETDHFRVPLCLCFKASQWVWSHDFACMKTKLRAELIFIWKVSHLDFETETQENSEMAYSLRILSTIIHQIFLLARDWFKHVPWPNIPS